jgi:hypothetical protein
MGFPLLLAASIHHGGIARTAAEVGAEVVTVVGVGD